MRLALPSRTGYVRDMFHTGLRYPHAIGWWSNMNGLPCSNDLCWRAAEIAATFRVCDGLYLIGSLERGVTVYSQQVRAHNLAWALWQLSRCGRLKVGQVAIVGGGIAGLTAASCILSRFEQAVTVTVFEQLWDLCPLQQGADHRWLHPRIYDWPGAGSRAPSASLPVLNWSEGRASDVARTIVYEFSRYCERFSGLDDRVKLYIGLRHFQITGSSRKIEWIANNAIRSGGFFHVGTPEGSSSAFDIIILAAGFGLETVSPQYPTESYWRNEQYGQPLLGGSRQPYVISGFGDGALIDLCRLTIERFRQDTILYELFDNEIDAVEGRLADGWREQGSEADSFSFFTAIEETLLTRAQQEICRRIRKDTRVCLHVRGKTGNVRAFQDIFGPHSSFSSRLMTFLLYRCGAFGLSFEELDTAVLRHGAPAANVLCRYGADPMAHLRSMFVDFSAIEDRLKEIKKDKRQPRNRLWPPGVFPHYSEEA
jgi:hypothetical protein